LAMRNRHRISSKGDALTSLRACGNVRVSVDYNRRAIGRLSNQFSVRVAECRLIPNVTKTKRVTTTHATK
jgi:hypothetical protein